MEYEVVGSNPPPTPPNPNPNPNPNLNPKWGLILVPTTYQVWDTAVTTPNLTPTPN